MRFQSAGAYASLLLFSGRALGAVKGSPANATTSTGDDDFCEPDETVVSTILASSSAFSTSASIVPIRASGSLVLSAGASASAIAQVNGTSGEELTTMTVLTTSIRTVISCAPSVTNCPANSASLASLASSAPEQVATVLVTDTIQLATTICPVTAAEAVSSSVYSAAATGGITGITVVSPQSVSVSSEAPLPTIVASSAGSGVGNGAGPSGVASSSVAAAGTTLSAAGGAAGPSGVASSSIAAVGTSLPSVGGGVGPSGLPTVSVGGTVPAGGVQASAFPSVVFSGSAARPFPSGSGVAPIQSGKPAASGSQGVPRPFASSAGVMPYPVGNFSIPSIQQVTSTVYATNVYTVTSCAASITDCPARGSVATEVVPVSTTVIASTLASSEVAALSSSAAASYSSAIAFSSAATITGAPTTTAVEEQTTLTVQITQVGHLHALPSCIRVTANSRQFRCIPLSLAPHLLPIVLLPRTRRPLPMPFPRWARLPYRLLLSQASLERPPQFALSPKLLQCRHKLWLA